MKIIKKEQRHLVKVTAIHDGIGTYTLSYQGGVHTFKGSVEEFAKFLRRVKASDDREDPKTNRSMTYLNMATEITNGTDTTIWIWSNILNQFKGIPIYMKDNKMKKVKEIRFDIFNWDRRNLFDGESFISLVNQRRITKLYRIISNAVEYNRIKFNRMDYRQQQDYMDRVNKEKVKYAFSMDNKSSYYEIPKGAFDYVQDQTDQKIPVEDKNYYQRYGEDSKMKKVKEISRSKYFDESKKEYTIDKDTFIQPNVILEKGDRIKVHSVVLNENVRSARNKVFTKGVN